MMTFPIQPTPGLIWSFFRHTVFQSCFAAPFDASTNSAVQLTCQSATFGSDLTAFANAWALLKTKNPGAADVMLCELKCSQIVRYTTMDFLVAVYWTPVAPVPNAAVFTAMMTDWLRVNASQIQDTLSIYLPFPDANCVQTNG